MDKLSYALGLSFGQQVRQNNIKGIDYAAFAQGIEDMCEGHTPKISMEETQALLNEYVAKLEKEAEEAGVEARREGEAFLSNNAKREGVIVLPSGLQYEVLTKGNGAIPTEKDHVRVHYHGTLPDGTVFDSSVRRGEPAEFGVTQVIQGWVEALQLMPVGSKWKLCIPSDLAYGAHGAGQIKPHSALVFEVELLAIV